MSLFGKKKLTEKQAVDKVLNEIIGISFRFTPKLTDDLKPYHEGKIKFETSDEEVAASLDMALAVIAVETLNLKKIFPDDPERVKRLENLTIDGWNEGDFIEYSKKTLREFMRTAEERSPNHLGQFSVMAEGFVKKFFGKKAKVTNEKMAGLNLTLAEYFQGAMQSYAGLSSADLTTDAMSWGRVNRDFEIITP